jgi:cyd operon protein YbgT
MGVQGRALALLAFYGVTTMWYFTWILGLGFAAAFAAMNAMWLELNPGAFGDDG